MGLKSLDVIASCLALGFVSGELEAEYNCVRASLSA
jgi:hypothetical protein